jgi:hypothetical protein
VIWGGLHLFSVGLAIGAATLVAHLVTNPAAWPLAGFLATALYLIVSAGQPGRVSNLMATQNNGGNARFM